MSRSLSSTFHGAIHGAQTEQAFLILLTVTHADLGTPLRYVYDNENVTSGGDLYTAHPFEITLADERDDQPPEIVLVIDNVDREPLTTLRALDSPPTITIEVVLASAPDTIEIGPITTELRGVQYDAFTVRGTLAFEPVLSEPYPGYVFEPRLFPAAFV